MGRGNGLNRHRQVVSLGRRAPQSIFAPQRGQSMCSASRRDLHVFAATASDPGHVRGLVVSCSVPAMSRTGQQVTVLDWVSAVSYGRQELVSANAAEQFFCGDHTVETAGAKSFEIECDEFEAERTKSQQQFATDLKFDETRQILERNFDSGQVSLVVSHTQHRKPRRRSHCSAWSIIRLRSGVAASP